MTTSEDCGFTFTWIIENISDRALYSELESPKFVATCLHKTEWTLGCSSREDIKSHKIEKYFHLRKIYTEPYCITLGLEFSFFDDNQVLLETRKVARFRFHMGDSIVESKLWRAKDQFLNIKTIQCRMWEIGTKFCDTEQGFGRTRLCIERRTFTWTVDKCNWLGPSFVTLYSKKCPSRCANLTLNTSVICERKLQIELRINCICSSYCSSIGHCISYPYVKDCQMSVLDIKGNVMVFPDQENWKTNDFYGFRQVFPKEQSHDTYFFLFPINFTNQELAEIRFRTDTLSFQCECTMCFGVELNQLEDANSAVIEHSQNVEGLRDNSKSETSSAKPSSNFMEDMQQLRQEEQFCDFSLKTETAVFPVHRAILSVRSPVFKAMFSNNMKENITQSVDIPDLSADTVKRMLAYVYTDRVDNISWRDAFNLYIAADKYQMLPLKERCSFVLQSNLCPSNVCEILVLADERNDANLKRAAQDYIVDHDADVIHLAEWKDIERNKPELGIDILRKMVVKRQMV